MKREELKALGLTDEQLDHVMALNGQDITTHQQRLQATQAELDSTKAQLADAGKQIESFKGMNIDQIKASAAEWQTKAEQTAAEAQKQIGQLRFDHALETALTGAKARDVIAVRAHLKTGDLKLGEDGTIIGLAEQLEKIKTSADYLFEDAAPTPKFAAGAKPKTTLSDKVLDAARMAAGLKTSEE